MGPSPALLCGSTSANRLGWKPAGLYAAVSRDTFWRIFPRQSPAVPPLAISLRAELELLRHRVLPPIFRPLRGRGRDFECLLPVRGAKNKKHLLKIMNHQGKNAKPQPSPWALGINFNFPLIQTKPVTSALEGPTGPQG